MSVGKLGNSDPASCRKTSLNNWVTFPVLSLGQSAAQPSTDLVTTHSFIHSQKLTERQPRAWPCVAQPLF